MGELSIRGAAATGVGLLGALVAGSAARRAPAQPAGESTGALLREGGRVVLGVAIWVGGMALASVPGL